MAGPARSQLFDEGSRADTSPRGLLESTYDFLSRAGFAHHAHVRKLLQEWYFDYPDHNGDLRSRFRSSDDSQHIAAWWELYVYTLYRRLGYSIAVHPPVGSGKPDFFMERHVDGTHARGNSFYVECAASFSADTIAGYGDISRSIQHIAEGVESSQFRIMLQILSTGIGQPRKRDVTEPIESWLSALDVNMVFSDLQSARDAGSEYNLPKLVIAPSDWIVLVVALPRDMREPPSGRTMLGMLPHTLAPPANDIARIREVIRNKGRKYGDTLTKPLVVALLNWSLLGTEGDVTDALLGSRLTATSRDNNGYWRHRSSPRGSGGSRVSGVVLGHNLNHSSMATTLPTTWINPWATQTLDATDCLPKRVVEGSEMISASSQPTPDARTIFGLPPGWPRL